MNEGFFKLQRKFFKNPMWLERRSFSRAEAFLDLLQSAAFTPTKRLCAGVMVELQIGQLIGSERYLSGRWGWSTKKVRSFLDMAETEQMLVVEKKRGGSILTLCNYEKYALNGSLEEAPKKHERSVEEAPRKRIEEVKEKKELEGTEQEVVDLWNSIASLPSIRVVTPKRKTAISARLKNGFFRENWKASMLQIPNHPFLMGENNRGWKADFDWFLQPDTVPKITEGKYSEGKKLSQEFKASDVGI